MNNDKKLANLILLEAESLRECSSLSGSLVLAEELTKDAIALAKLTLIKSEESMNNVIDIMTGEPLEVLPFDKEQAEQVLAYLLNYKIDEAQVNFGERYMLNTIMKFIENNSSANSMEILNRKKA